MLASVFSLAGGVVWMIVRTARRAAANEPGGELGGELGGEPGTGSGGSAESETPV